MNSSFNSLTTTLAACAIGIAALLAGRASAEVIHVNAATKLGGDGSSWLLAMNDLQAALAVAAPGDEIWVAAGIYKPASRGGSPAASFALKPGVALYGGFAGNEHNRAERDWTVNETILSGDLNGDDGPPGSFINYEENVWNVVTAEGNLTPTTVLDGFTITGGNASIGSPHFIFYGGGLYVDAPATITLAHCTFIANRAQHRGGAVYFFGSPVQDEWNGVQEITDCRFTHNHSDSEGGAVFRDGRGAISIVRCTFTNNSAGTTFGGGALAFAHGAAFDGSSQQFVRDSVFIGNTAPSAGAILSYVSWPNIVNCLIIDNEVAEVQSGWAGRGGGVLYISSAGSITNCTVANNTGANGAGICIVGTLEPVTIANTIVYGNTPDALCFETFSELLVHHSLIEGGWDGEGNLDKNPQFLGPGDYQIAADSPCIDAGDSDAIEAGVVTDLLGNPRVADGDGDCTAVIDIGAYEFQPTILGDLDSDGDVDFDDFTQLLASWGPCPDCAADLDGDDDVDFDDFTALLAAWGPCG